MAAWVTSVSGSWRGDRGGQLQAAPWREQQSLEKERQRPPAEQGWAGRSPGRDPAPAAGQPPARHPTMSRQRDCDHEKWVCWEFLVLLSKPSLS